jgi:hypothetical protein
VNDPVVIFFSFIVGRHEDTNISCYRSTMKKLKITTGLLQKYNEEVKNYNWTVTEVQ